MGSFLLTKNCPSLSLTQWFNRERADVTLTTIGHRFFFHIFVLSFPRKNLKMFSCFLQINASFPMPLMYVPKTPGRIPLVLKGNKSENLLFAGKNARENYVATVHSSRKLYWHYSNFCIFDRLKSIPWLIKGHRAVFLTVMHVQLILAFRRNQS